MTDIGWKFPRTDGGMESGINDAGIVTFDGAPLPSLAREVIQNSVDERDDPAMPVHITFQLSEVSTSEIGGGELARHLDECIAAWKSDQKASDALQSARLALDSPKVSLLGVLDQNTTGLVGEKWHTLVKMEGASFKRSEDAGGSFGIGKAAPFTVSPLRAVFYWSAFREQDRMVEQFQGKAVLVSHQHDFGEGPETTQSVGFYGLIDGCEALRDGIPSVFRHTDGGQPVQGTAVWVVGFKHGERWQTAVRRSVLENFFYAIHRNDLEVLLEPGGDDDVLNNGTLSRQFDLLVDPSKEIDDDEAIDRARMYWGLVDGSSPIAEELVTDLGIVKLWIATEDQYPDWDFPNRVALIRRTGMVVTDQQEGHRFRGLRDYVAVCVIEDEEANKLLRRMENPAHDKFEFHRLPEHERDKGRRALDRLKKFLRRQLGIHAALPQIEVSEVVDELTDYLFDDRPGPLEGASARDGAEAAFGEIGAIKRKQPRLLVRPQVTLDADLEEVESAEGGDGDEVGETGGGRQGPGDGIVTENGNGEGPGVGGSAGGTGKRGGSKGRRVIELEDVRVLHDPANPHRARIRFTTPTALTAKLLIDEAGDASAIQRTDLTILDEHGDVWSGSQREFRADTRHEFTIVGEQALADAAWQVAALVEDSL